MRRRSIRRYLTYLGWFSAAALFVVAAVNFCFDPFDIYASLFKGRYPIRSATTSRISKAYLVRSLEPDAIILGTSRPLYGYRADHPRLVADNAYNLAHSAASIYEIRRYMQHAAAFDKLKVAIVGVDYESFAASNVVNEEFDEKRLSVDPQGHFQALWFVEAIKLLFAFDALHRQFESADTDESLSEYGQYSAAAIQSELTIGSMPNFVRRTLWSRRRLFSKNSHDFDTDVHGHLKTMDELSAIVDEARQKHVHLYLVINPIHAMVQEEYSENGGYDGWINWKRSIASIAFGARTADFDVHVWDFATINDATQEPLAVLQKPDPVVQERLFMEPWHFSPRLGDRVLEDILSRPEDPKSGLGAELSPDMLDGHFAADKVRFEQWRQVNGEVVATVKAWISQPPD